MRLRKLDLIIIGLCFVIVPLFLFGLGKFSAANGQVLGGTPSFAATVHCSEPKYVEQLIAGLEKGQTLIEMKGIRDVCIMSGIYGTVIRTVKKIHYHHIPLWIVELEADGFVMNDKVFPIVDGSMIRYFAITEQVIPMAKRYQI